MTPPNKRASLDAAVAFSLLFGRHLRRTSDLERSAPLSAVAIR
jgi:hypothetical protein